MQLKVSSYIFYIVCIAFLSSCSAFKKSTGDNTARNQKNSKFINGIEIAPDTSVTGGRYQEKEKKQEEKSETKKANAYIKENFNIESASVLQAKYCTILDVPIETLSDDSTLLQEIDYWWGTPYRMGGATKSGIDCSAFTQILLQDVFDITIPRTAQLQYNSSIHSNSKAQLEEGDLVFFGTSKRHISHVGVYITNNKFVHASSSRGVMISDLNDAYWRRRYVASGRYNTD